MHRTALVALPLLLVATPAFAAGGESTKLEWSVGASWSNVGLTAAKITEPAPDTTRVYAPGARLALPRANFSLIHAGSSFVIGDRWVIPIFQTSFGGVAGPTPTAAGTFDGDPARVNLRGAFRSDVGILGFGVRGNHRRWSGGIRAVPTVVIVANVRATVPDGPGTVDLTMNTVYFGIRAEFEGCRRLDPRTRLCVVGAPSLFDGRPFNGFTFGFRMDLGL
jgi:hypothetical protein